MQEEEENEKKKSIKMKPEKSLAMLLSQEISATLKKYSLIIIQWGNKDSWECFFPRK